MLRISARLGLSGRQQETCVPDAGLRGQTLANTMIVYQSARPQASSRCKMFILVAILPGRPPGGGSVGSGQVFRPVLKGGRV